MKEGKARLVVEAQSNDFRGATDTISTDVDVVLRPPSVSADGFQHYINQGGSEMVLLTPSGSWSEAGVRVGKDTYRSFPDRGQHGSDWRCSRIPGTLPIDTAPVVFAKNSAGTEATARFWFKIFPEEIPDARSDHRRQVSGQSCESDRSGRIGRSADALSQDQWGYAPREQQDAGRSALQDGR